tara:strand:+ start:130 stop:402 length:273 start_codon:yes stop_codon:yes gene_type:complete
MGSIKRKMARNKAKRAKRDIKRHMHMFGKMGQECTNCEAPYDKTSKEHAMTWRVVVREAEEKVNLYCPDCWETAMDVVEDYMSEGSNKHE